MGNEWYTPKKYIDAAREVLGEIDLDPASCEWANEMIRAKKFYTKEQNGLMYHWYGRIWLNPPYGKTEIGGASHLEAFTRYLVNQYKSGNVTEAILLIPLNLATSWFTLLTEYVIYAPHYRISFLDESGNVGRGSSFGTCFIYMGMNEQRFKQVFRHFKPGSFLRAESPELPVTRHVELWSA